MENITFIPSEYYFQFLALEFRNIVLVVHGRRDIYDVPRTRQKLKTCTIYMGSDTTHFRMLSSVHTSILKNNEEKEKKSVLSIFLHSQW